MRIRTWSGPTWSGRTAVAGLLMATLAVTAPAAAVAPAAAPSVAGTWKGPFLGYTFTFEFKQVANGWTGRYQSDKANKWVELQNLEVSDGTIRFSVVSTPPSVYMLKVDATGKALAGAAQIGQFPSMPLNLTRVS